MDTTIILVYCLCDDLLKAQLHHEDVQCQLSDAEIMTSALVAALYFGGNQAKANCFLVEQNYIRCQLSRSRFCRRLQRVRKYYELLFGVLGDYFKTHNAEQLYVMDSMPVSVCDERRTNWCHIYKDKAYRGYIPSKKKYHYGLKLHLLVTGAGAPVEYLLTPASYHDATCLPWFPLDLEPGATIYADKAYNYRLVEEQCAEAGIDFSPIRKSNSKHPDPAWKRYLQSKHRKRIETTYSLFERILPKHIHAVTAAGFETKVVLFLLAVTINCLAT